MTARKTKTRRPRLVVVSTKISPDLSLRLRRIAKRRVITLSALLAELVGA